MATAERPCILDLISAGDTVGGRLKRSGGRIPDMSTGMHMQLKTAQDLYHCVLLRPDADKGMYWVQFPVEIGPYTPIPSFSRVRKSNLQFPEYDALEKVQVRGLTEWYDCEIVRLHDEVTRGDRQKFYVVSPVNAPAEEETV